VLAKTVKSAALPINPADAIVETDATSSDKVKINGFIIIPCFKKTMIVFL
jgi:hypothetical protein